MSTVFIFAVMFFESEVYTPRELLTLEEIGDEKPDICGALCQTAHEIRIPMSPEWNIHTYRITFLEKFLLQITSNSVKHLKLQPVLGEAYFSSILFCKGNAFFVMRANGWNGGETSVL